MGDPRGVGPEVIVKALHNRGVPADVHLIIVGSMAVLQQAAGALGQELRAARVANADWKGEEPAVLDLDNFPVAELEPRRPDALGGRASVEYIERAVRLVLGGKVDALVTAPINKEAIGAAGSPFPGHTEMLAHLGSARRPVMMLVSAHLRVGLVTTHIALRDVPRGLRTEDIVEAAQVLAGGLRRFFGLGAPRIAVCGLNPHCGDGGRFGDEEARIVAPAIERARSAGVDLQGPKPADTVFAQAQRGDYDAVLALYHDQGMIPVKMGGLADVVDVTLGLPFIRTGVGHGTAYDIAGRGQADERSLVSAIRLAARMTHASRNGSRRGG
jgi:4-hydroxythreonine-4-phosphate dehydrogenase